MWYRGVALRCRSCEARDAAAEKFRSDPNASLAGMHFAVERRED